MCLAVPGRIVSIGTHSEHRLDPAPAGPEEDDLWRIAVVDFGGVRQEVSLACLPQARVGDQVLVHVGLALSVVDSGQS